MTSKVTVTACCADSLNVIVLVTDERNLTMKMEALNNSESKDYYVYDDITISLSEVKKVTFNSEDEAIEILTAEGVTLDSNKWMDLDTSLYTLTDSAACAVAYLCTEHGFEINI